MGSTVQKTILRCIRSVGRGSVFTPKDFLDVRRLAAIDQALSRLARTGDLQRLGRGLYYYTTAWIRNADNLIAGKTVDRAGVSRG